MDTCPVCSWRFSNGDLKSAVYPTVSQEHGQAEVPTTIRFCGSCGLGVAFPPISDETIDALYAQGEYWQKASPRGPLKFFPVPFGLAQVRWRLTEECLTQAKKVAGIRLLDIGAGHGYVGLVASQSTNISIIGYDAVESDPVMRQYLLNMWKAWGRKQMLDVMTSMDQATGDYDVVVLSHVLEHVRNPLSLMESAVSLLSPGGLLFVDVPNQDHLFKDDVFPHALFFSSSSLRTLLEKGPLEVISIGVWGRNMYKSPLHAKAPISMKLVGQVVRRGYRFLPRKFLVRFYAWYFGINRQDADGTWVRALCSRKSL